MCPANSLPVELTQPGGAVRRSRKRGFDRHATLPHTAAASSVRRGACTQLAELARIRVGWLARLRSAVGVPHRHGADFRRRGVRRARDLHGGFEAGRFELGGRVFPDSSDVVNYPTDGVTYRLETRKRAPWRCISSPVLCTKLAQIRPEKQKPPPPGGEYSIVPPSTPEETPPSAGSVIVAVTVTVPDSAVTSTDVGLTLSSLTTGGVMSSSTPSRSRETRARRSAPPASRARPPPWRRWG